MTTSNIHRDCSTKVKPGDYSNGVIVEKNLLADMDINRAMKT